MKRRKPIWIFFAILVAVLWSRPAFCTMEQVKILKGVFPGKEKYSCTICHVDKLPKKDSHELNDYGKKALEAAGGHGMQPTAEVYQKLGDPDTAK